MTGEPFDLVVVCTANRFRSPLAAALLHESVAGLPVRVRSYAVNGAADRRALEQAVELGRPLGVDLSRHRSRSLEPGDLAAADLVVGFERTHMASAVVEGGAPRGRTFTLPELVPLAERLLPPAGGPVERARAVVAAAHELRGEGVERLPELADPSGGPARGYEDAARDIDRLVRRLARSLFGADAATER